MITGRESARGGQIVKSERDNGMPGKVWETGRGGGLRGSWLGSRRRRLRSGKRRYRPKQ
jgi:hypothetical protein